jgi:hypothetical protein
MHLSLQRAARNKAPTYRRTGGRSAALTAIALLATALIVAGCDGLVEQTLYGYDVWNYTPNRYVVRVTFQDGTVTDRGVPPDGIMVDSSASAPRQVVVYDQTCSQKLATFPLTHNSPVILIDASGHISIPLEDMVRTPADPSPATPEPAASSCPAG